MISFREKNYMYSYNKMKPKAFSTHLHKYYEFLYFVQGDATYIVEGSEYTAEDGDLFVTCPGELHSIVFKSDKDYERHFIQISEEFLEGLEIDLLEKLKNKKFGENNKISHKIATDNILRCFEGVGKFVLERRKESDLLVKTFVIQLLEEVNELMGKSEESKTGENERVSMAKSYINQNLDKSLTLDKIAEAAYTDKYYLSHLFKSETGMRLTDYINVQRIALAKRLISQGARATEVYSDCGFSDYSTFYRAFKKLSGKSPAEFFNKMK